MKSLTLLFILIIIASSYANSILFPNLLRRNNEGISEECIEETDNSEYGNECMHIITIGNYKQSCTDIKTEKCQNFYNDPSNETLQPLIFKDLVEGLYSKCLTDEEGNLCSYSIYAITQTSQKEAISDTCKSKKCTDSLIEVLKKVNIDRYYAYENLSFTIGNYSYQDLNAVKNVLSILEFDKCKSSHVTSNTGNIVGNDTAANASSTLTNKTNNILIILLSLVLLLIYH
ncbi:hypothetical protein PIROE2DRAFT_3998 [Piromyces sp. E2]|nr:hypothetical protein PIROE2DRAFT_3998 [Piromyces sp. E2]|eukprot:OUM68393.1 hypothetical protein PIROE2DRAFT_3998 [Piromyces sp. E2]